MNIYCRGDGYIFHIDPERIYQGSAGVNTIRFIGCFPSTAQVLVSYKLPNGLLTSPKILTFVSKLEEVSAPENGGKYSVWETVLGSVPRLDIDGKVLQDGNGNIVYDLDYTITENYGTAEMRFFIYPASYSVAIDDIIYNVGEGSLATAKMFFTIEKGDPALIPPIEELTSNDAKILLAEILNMVSSSNQNIDVVETELNEKIDGKQDGLGFAGYYDRKNSPVVTYAYLLTSLAQKQDNLTFDGMYSPTVNPVATVQTVANKLAEIIGNAPESLNTLEEIAAWIAAHPEDIAELNALIAQNTQSIEALQKRQSELIVKNIQQDGRFVDIEEGIARLQYEDDVLHTNITQNDESLSELRQEFEDYVSGGGFGVDDETVKAIVEEETSPKFDEIALDIKAIYSALTNKQNTVSFDGDYNATTNKAATVATVSREIAKLVADAPEAFNTLEEIAKWIAEHPESVAQLNALIAQNSEAIAQLQETAITKTNVEEAVDSALEEAKASGEFDGPRGTGILNTTTGIAAYTTAVNGVTPAYRILLSTLKTQAKVNEVLIGDSVRYSFYLYPVITMDETYAYLGTRVSIRGATGAAGATGATGKTAYQYAQDGGYTGTETEFAAKLAKEIPSKTSQLENDSEFIKASEAPVQSVNGKTGAVTLSASDVEADASGTAETKVSIHNASTASHSDIRLLIEGLTTRLNALANSDDTTLDQMKEVVDYIKSNRDLIKSITTDKVSYTDIVNDLTTSVINKPLSAAQGVALKALIDAITVPTKVSQLVNDSQFVKESTSITLTGVDANGVTHTYTIYGKES